ncbi:30S ribosomal protein S20 [Nonomuraea dietziae]|uniref:30S ribosomal protein S20 n=1 Tax=Nonomuraea dietziae TaxID=65515 RepID=UPI003389C66E
MTSIIGNLFNCVCAPSHRARAHPYPISDLHRGFLRGETQVPDQAQKQNEKARLRNKAVKSSLKTAIRSSARPPTRATSTRPVALQRVAARQLDKAASKGVIHKNQAANPKSRSPRAPPRGR